MNESIVKYAFIEVHTGYVIFLSQNQAESRDPNEIVSVPHLDIPEEKV